MSRYAPRKSFSEFQAQRRAEKVSQNVRRGRATRMVAKRRAQQAAIELLNSRTGGLFALENKFYDTFLQATALVANSTNASCEYDPVSKDTISAPAQGDGPSNRDGKEIHVNSVFVSGMITVPARINQTALDNACRVFIALVQDKQTNGAQLNSEDVYSNPSGAEPLMTNPLRNLQYSKRFRVLATASVDLTQYGATYDGSNLEIPGFQQEFMLTKKLDMKVAFGIGTTESVANIIDNSLHVIAFTTSDDMSPLIQYNSRIRFTG